MKSARDRAEEAAELGCVPHGVYRRNFLEKVALMFKEHARDQREECAGAVADSLPAGSADYYPTLERVRNSTRNAPAPGGGR